MLSTWTSWIATVAPAVPPASAPMPRGSSARADPEDVETLISMAPLPCPSTQLVSDALLVMAFIVMAYIVMAYIVMA